MDVAYDHIQEEQYRQDENARDSSQEAGSTANNLSAEFQEAYKAVSSSPWGAKLGGWMATAKKQGESYYENAQKEYTNVSGQASKGFTDLRDNLINRTRGISLTSPVEPGSSSSKDLPADSSASETPKAKPSTIDENPERPESLPQDILNEGKDMFSKIREGAAKRLKDIERAEDAADEALLKFGTNMRDWFKDAVTIAPPPTGDEVLASGTAGGAVNLDAAREQDGKGSTVLFESKDAEGKRVIHTTRFDAQLHAIHSSANSFVRDPPSGEFDPWAEKFGDVSSKERTEQITKDLEKYEELRRAMEKLVPEQVEYATFWKRYYFLRHIIEEQEKKRKEMLKDAADADDEVAWDEDSDSDAPSATKEKFPDKSLNSSKETLKAEKELLKPSEGRKSGDGNSQADSDASYDVVSAQSGATSRAPGSPGESRKKDDDSDEDWE